MPVLERGSPWHKSVRIDGLQIFGARNMKGISILVFQTPGMAEGLTWLNLVELGVAFVARPDRIIVK